VSPITTRNPYQLGVSLANAFPFFPTVRKWRYATDFEGGFRFLEAKTESVEGLQILSEYNFNELADQLMGLAITISMNNNCQSYRQEI